MRPRKSTSSYTPTTERGLGERLALNFHDYEPDSEGFKTLLLISDRWSGHAFDFYLKDHITASIKEALTFLFDYLKQQYKIDVKVIECDNEIIHNKPELTQLLKNRLVRIEPSAPYTQDQNGGAERLGAIIKDKARAMRISS